MKFKFLVPVVALAALFSFTSCGGDDNDDNIGIVEPIGPGQGSGNTVEQQKEYVGATARMLMNKFKPEEQSELVSLLKHINDTYGHLEFPTDEDDEDYYPYRNVGRSNSDFDVIAMAAMYAGIYEPGRYEWVRVGDSDDLVFRTDDINYGHIELKAVVSKDSNSATVKDPYEENDSYNVVVPKSVTVTLTAGGKTMLSQVFTNTFDLSAGTLKATETLSAANIRVETVLNATNSQATSNVSFSVSGEQIISGTAVINGRNLCNPEYIANIVDNEAWASLLSNGTFNANILDRIKVNGNVTFTPQLFEVYDDLSFDYGWGDMTREEASKECDNAVKVIANSVNAWLSFGNSSSREAWLVPVKRNYEWNSGWDDQEYGEYDAEWVVKFADGTTYSDDLLETGFDAVLNQWYQLVRSYQNCWN